jgi:hypothetical protein
MATAVPMNYAPGSFSPYQTPTQTQQMAPTQAGAYTLPPAPRQLSPEETARQQWQAKNTGPLPQSRLPTQALSPEQTARQQYEQRMALTRATQAMPVNTPPPPAQPQALSANTQPYKAEPMPATKPLSAPPPSPAQKQPIQPPQRSAPQRFGSQRPAPQGLGSYRRSPNAMSPAQRSSAYSRALGRTQ